MKIFRHIRSLLLWVISVSLLNRVSGNGGASWAEKLKRRVSAQQPQTQQAQHVNQQHSMDDSTHVYYPFTVERDVINLCTAASWTCRDIDRIHLNHQAKSIYLRDRKPVVLTTEGDSPVKSWKALKWNLWYWASKALPVLNNVLEFEKPAQEDNYNNVFLLRDEDLPDRIDDIDDNPLSSFPQYQVQEEMLLWDFLYDIGSKDEKPVPEQKDEKNANSRDHDDAQATAMKSTKENCRFYSQDYEEMERMMKLDSDTDWKSLRIEEELGLPDEDEDQLASSFFNILYPGCSLQLRHSDYHTAKVQVFGRSRYYIISPSSLAQLFPFPSTSVHSHQLQINLYSLLGENGDLDWGESAIAQSLLASKDLLDYVELSPGETLFVPPGYAVLTEAITLSITIDVLSPSREQVLFMEALLTPLPMTRYTDQNKKNPSPLSQDEKAIYTQVYLAHLISRIDGISSIGRYIRKLYKSRYSFHYPLDSLSMQTLANSFDCYKNKPEFHDKLVKSMHPVQVEKVAGFVAEKFNDNLLLASGIKWVLLGNYIERIVRDLWETKELAWVPLYLTSCLDIDSKIKVVEEVEGPPVMKLNPIY